MSSYKLQVPEYPEWILQARRSMNDEVETRSRCLTKWYDAPSPAEFRLWRQRGINGFKAPAHDPTARTLNISPHSQGEPPIDLRYFQGAECHNGIFLWIHGGGFVFGGASEQDDLLRTLADKLSMTIVAVEYRLAPENPFPACVHDCLAAALYCLSSEGTSTLQGRLRAIGGDSAGAYLALKVTLDLRDRGIQVHEDIAALILLYGVFSLSPTPSLASHTREIILSRRDMEKFIEAAFPCAEAPLASRSHHGQSVLYESLVALPPAFILCGTQDPLIDDSVFLAGRYYIAGNEVEIRIEREAPHAFITIPMGEASETGMEAILNYMRSRMRKATGE